MSDVDGEVGKAVVPLSTAGQGLDVRIASELVERARAEGVSLVGQGGLLAQVTRAVLQAALEAEMADHHLGYDRGEPRPAGQGNERNGSSAKTVRTEIGEVALDVPRDRAGTFAPQIVPKHARRVEGFDEAIISRVTDKVNEELAAWQSRPLDRVYPVVLIDAVYVKIRVLSPIL